jgi:hypothetical protein
VARRAGWRDRKRSKGGEKPEAQQAIPFQEAQSPEAQPEELRVFPFELRPGDRVTLADGCEWEVVALPSGYQKGKMATVRLRKPGSRADGGEVAGCAGPGSARGPFSGR